LLTTKFDSFSDGQDAAQKLFRQATVSASTRITAAFSLSPNCLKVIDTFLDQKAMDGKKLTTDGKRLDGNWMGGNGIAEWEGGKIHFNDLGSKAAETVQNAVKKAAPKNWLATSSAPNLPPIKDPSKVARTLIMAPRPDKQKIIEFALRLSDDQLDTASREFEKQGPALWRFWVKGLEARKKAGMKATAAEKNLAFDIADYVMKERPTNKQLIDKFGVNLKEADAIIRNSAEFFGPGGKGFAKYVKFVQSILMKGLKATTSVLDEVAELLQARGELELEHEVSLVNEGLAIAFDPLEELLKGPKPTTPQNDPMFSLKDGWEGTAYVSYGVHDFAEPEDYFDGGPVNVMIGKMNPMSGNEEIEIFSDKGSGTVTFIKGTGKSAGKRLPIDKYGTKAKGRITRAGKPKRGYGKMHGNEEWGREVQLAIK
jgi:hypothetical protein